MNILSIGFLAGVLLVGTGGNLLPSDPVPKAAVPVQAKTIQVGQKAPDFTLESHTGQKVKLSAAFGKTPTVLVFYRGYW